MLYNLDEAILNIGKGRSNIHGDKKTNETIYSRWETRYSTTIEDFYKDFIQPRLPKPEIVRKWHQMLVDYSQMDGAIFPIRDGHTNADDDKIKLRRGWLVRVDDHLEYEKKFSYTFTDNYFAAYIYKMALDEYCPSVKEFFEYMTVFKDASDIGWLTTKKGKVDNSVYGTEPRRFISMPIRFGQIGKSTYPGNTESIKNAYINTSPAPTCPFGSYGYKHAHIFPVKGIYAVNKIEIAWKDNNLVLLGEESTSQQDYQWDDTIHNFVWDRKMTNTSERDSLRELIVAHFLRFVDPMNHFLAPMQGCNKYTNADGEYSLDIAEYDRLTTYLQFAREREYGRDFDDYRKVIAAPANLQAIDYGTDEIRVIYHESTQEAATRKCPTITKSASAKSTSGKPSSSAKSSTEKAAKTSSGKPKQKTLEELEAKYSRAKLIEVAACYLNNRIGLKELEKRLHLAESLGFEAQNILHALGINTSRNSPHKGLLLAPADIDDEIAKATDTFKTTLEEIKARGLYPKS